MKKIWTFLMLFSLICTASANFKVTDDESRQALYNTIDQASESIKKAPFGNKTVAILPVRGVSPQFSSMLVHRLKNVVTKAGFNCVEGKEDPMWNEIIKEFAWDERKDDILDPATVAKFGKLKAAQILLQCKILTIDKNPDRIYAEIELHATDIITKQHIWGDNFACRFYVNKKLEGIVDLTNDQRMLLKKNFEVAYSSMISAAFSDKLANVKEVTVIPLAGDVKQYMTGLALEAIARTKMIPKNPMIPTLSLVRSTARDKKLESDAIFYGSVRQLSRSLKESYTSKDKQYRVDHYTVEADVQLFLEDAKTGNVLWSKTITFSEICPEQTLLTTEEIKKLNEENFNNIPSDIKGNIADNWPRYLLYFFCAIAGIAILFGLLLGLKVAFSFFSIR